MNINHLFILLLICTASGFAFYKKSTVVTISVLFYLLSIVITEMMAGFLKYTFSRNNIWVYNLYTLTAFGFWYYWLSRYLKKPNKAWIVCMGILGAVAMVELFVLKTVFEVATFTFSTGVLLYTLMFTLFFERLMSEAIIINDAGKLLFLCVGLGYFLGFFLDTILYPTGVLNRVLYFGISLDALLVRLVDYFFYFGLMLSFWLGYGPISNATRK